MSGKGIKYVTFERCTNLTLKRFDKILSSVKDLENITPLTPVQIRTLSAYATDLKIKKADLEGNLKKVFEHLSSDDFNEDTVIEHENKIQTLFIEASTLIEALLPTPEPSSPASVISNIDDPVTSQTHVKLPKLDLPKFDGSPVQWVSFINLFDTTIHQNNSSCRGVNFHYSLSLLSHLLEMSIHSLNITPQNYLTAYQILRDRYHSPRRLTTLHLNNILDLPNISTYNMKGLRNFINSFYEHTQALKSLDVDVTSSNPLLSAHLLRKLDQELRKKLEAYRTTNSSGEEGESASSHTLPSVEEIIKFLNIECDHVEDANLHVVSSVNKPDSKQPAFNSKHKSTAPKKGQFVSRDIAMFATNDISSSNKTSTKAPTPSAPCFVCKSTDHKIYSCPKFKGHTPNERFQIIKQHSRCTSCLGSHDLKNCRSRAKCFTCQKSHHTLLHFQNKGQTSNEIQVQTTQPPVNTFVGAHSQISRNNSMPYTTVVLGTALVKITGQNGRSHVFRALLDSGSMGDFLSEHAAQLLGVPRQRSDIVVTGLSGTSTQTRGLLNANIETLSGDTLAYYHPFHVLDKISPDLPRAQLSSQVIDLTKCYVLADPTFFLPSTVDVLLGTKILPRIFTPDVHSLGPDLPFVVGTQLGYVVMGQSPCKTTSSIATATVVLHSSNDVSLHDEIQRFWVQEQVPEYSKKSEEENYCDKHFIKTHSRTRTGRYCVKLPFKPNRPALGQSRQTAERRFFSLENKFKAQPHFQKLYTDFMQDYESSGHMEKIDNIDLTSQHYFLPHHGVLKQNGDVTKLRTVFDASCKTSTSVALNDILLTGKRLQINICDILLQFRIHDVVFSCDVRQMFRQIEVSPEDQKYQLILWRESTEQPLNTYKLTTVTYGMNSSPYLAIRTLTQLAEDEGHDFPEAAEVLKKSTYVDDIICGASTEDQALLLQEQLIALLQRGGFELRKWTSNSPRLLESLPKEHLESPVFLQEAAQPHYSILGLHWSPISDCFSYHLDLPLCPATKRLILSTIAKMYDPCGFLSPITMWCKAFMQVLWTQGLTWDEPINPDLAIKWQYFVSELKLLDKIQIPRPLMFSQASNIELHGFSDASEVGYAAVVYFRCEMPNGTVIVRQVISKTRVAPLKKVTLPRLELCGAHLLAQLVAYCMSVFNTTAFSAHYLWCDSLVALTWLKTPPYRLKTYVANRVSQAQECVPIHWWHYVSSEHNPADCASRGLLPSHLPDHSLWWSGPEWLLLTHADRPATKFTPVDICSSEETKPVPLTVLTSTSSTKWDLLSKYSTWTRLQYVVANILRFVHNCRNAHRHCGPLSSEELKTSELQIFKIVQLEELSEEIKQLKKKNTCSTRLQRLTPFMDSQGLLRVGGRLQKAGLPTDISHPVILPKKHPVVDLLIDYCHISHLHSGPQLTQALLCRNVWIISARSVIRSRLFKCVKCFKVNPRNSSPLMGDLPPSRVTPCRPFLRTGIDYAGPFTVKVLNLRAVRHSKVYFCVFVCLVTKATHLEVVTDLTADTFIAALSRFTSRRGLCSDLYSDCGTNFTGADLILQKIIQNSLYSSESRQKIQGFAAPKGIRFHFNPPAAPHQGGLWESCVKSVKYHLRRVMGDTVLTLMEFITLITQIEAMLNSRPLTPLSSDPSDLNALTPGHFLIHAPLAAVPERNLEDVPANRLKHWQLAQAIHQRIWQRWHLEYLNTLQQRSKWTQHKENLKIGDLVLIHCNSPPLSWPLARITAVHPGTDGVVRVVDLKTVNGHLTRPVVKVFRLPLE